MSKEIDPFSQDSPPSSRNSPLPPSSPSDEADWSGSRPSSPVDAPPPPQVPLPESPPPQASSSDDKLAPPPLPRSTSQQQRLLSPDSTRAYNARQNEDEPLTGIARALHQEGWSIEITDAYKTAEGSSSTYIVYVIRTGTVEARRRYSEFASLRTSLAHLYPTLIVPPIPSKTTFTEYTSKPTKAKEDAATIARRSRMLGTFLVRLGRHPILGNDAVFHRFLDGGVSWTEILHSPPLSHLPKNSLKAPAHDPTSLALPSASISPATLSTLQAAYAALPVPSPSHPLRQPDARFSESETFTAKFEKHLSGSMEKVNRRVMKRWGEQSNDYAELGAVLNGFSLTEKGDLAVAIERTGQAVDATYLSTTHLLQQWEAHFTEPLTDYVAFGQIIRKLLLYRHQKHLQYEMTSDQIEHKKANLARLEASEAEARRMEGALAAAGLGGSSTSLRASRQGEEGEGARSAITGNPAGPSRRGGNSNGAGSGGYGFLSALGHSLTGMIDVDPEATRRTNISKTRDTISQLEDALHLTAQDLKYSSQTIQADLDRFQRQKVADIRNMSISLAEAHRDWCKQNLEAWQEARVAIDEIEPHPALPPPLPKPSTSAESPLPPLPASPSISRQASSSSQSQQPKPREAMRPGTGVGSNSGDPRSHARSNSYLGVGLQ